MRLSVTLAAVLIAGAPIPLSAQEVADFPTLRGYSASTSVTVLGRKAANDGGGGIFVQNGSGCTADDDGVIIAGTTSAQLCWYRQFNGPVHLTWYGVKDAADLTLDCYASDTAFKACAADKTDNTDHTKPPFDAVAIAFLAAANKTKLPGADGGVVTDGRSIVEYNNDLIIPPNQYLTCDGPPGGQRPQSIGSAYYTLPNSIVLGPARSIKRRENSLLFNCIVRPTWYNTTQLTLVTDTHSLIYDIEHSFTGTATMCGFAGNSGEACDMHDMLVLGFDVCDDSSSSPRTCCAISCLIAMSANSSTTTAAA
jgi:hypothetical protein